MWANSHSCISRMICYPYKTKQRENTERYSIQKTDGPSSWIVVIVTVDSKATEFRRIWAGTLEDNRRAIHWKPRCSTTAVQKSFLSPRFCTESETLQKVCRRRKECGSSALEMLPAGSTSQVGFFSEVRSGESCGTMDLTFSAKKAEWIWATKKIMIFGE